MQRRCRGGAEWVPRGCRVWRVQSNTGAPLTPTLQPSRPKPLAAGNALGPLPSISPSEPPAAPELACCAAACAACAACCAAACSRRASPCAAVLASCARSAAALASAAIRARASVSARSCSSVTSRLKVCWREPSASATLCCTASPRWLRVFTSSSLASAACAASTSCEVSLCCASVSPNSSRVTASLALASSEKCVSTARRTCQRRRVVVGGWVGGAVGGRWERGGGKGTGSATGDGLVREGGRAGEGGCGPPAIARPGRGWRSLPRRRRRAARPRARCAPARWRAVLVPPPPREPSRRAASRQARATHS